MSRKPRVKSETDIYHVMMRGNNRQTVFFAANDYQKFLSIMTECKIIDAYTLYAYCLMPNHIHLLIRTFDPPLGDVMRRIESRFVTWYNARHERVGHLFQERFKSEPVQDDAYFCTVLRYIHLNPVKANLCRTPEQYPYSSYRNYFEPTGLIDSAYFENYFGVEEFYRFHQAECNEECMDMDNELNKYVADETAKERILAVTGCSILSDFIDLPAEKQKMHIQELLHQRVSLRQISRLTGLSFYKVQSRAKL